MYRTSKDRRFRKNKDFIRRAYLDLIMEKGHQNVSISDIAERADINRMTFYAHYDAVEDVFEEFVDEMEAGIEEAFSREEEFDLDNFFKIMNEAMYKEIDFFRFVAKQRNCSHFREAFREAIGKILRADIEANKDDGLTLITTDLASTCIAYAYFDWLSGKYGEMDLEEIIEVIKKLLQSGYVEMSYAK